MADFAKAHLKLRKVEGGYANDKDDAGGETWRGIARKFHPSWQGWRIIDKIKAANKSASVDVWNKLLMANKDLDRLELAFYKAEFWDIIHLDEIEIQETAEMIYDSAVNIGNTPAIRMAQNTAFNITGEDQAKELGIKYGTMDKATLNKINNAA